MKIETRDDQAFFEIKPGKERVFVSFGSTEVEVGTTPDLTLGEMALVVTVPGDYTYNRVNLGKGKYETRFLVTGKVAKGEGER